MFGIDDLVGAGLGALGGIAGGIIGSINSGSQRAAAQAAMQKASDIIQATGLPPDQSMPIVLQQFKQAGILTPQLEQNINQQYSQMANTYVDPATKQAQTQALQFMQQRGQLGFGPQERAAFNQVQQEVARDAEAKRQQIMQNMQSRHMGGSGAELAGALSAAQSGDQRASMAGDQIAAQAAQNALSAISQAGQLGGQMRSADFGEASTRAQAADQMNRFNVQSQQAAQQRNIAAQNQAQQYNIGNAQQISNANTAQGNQELYRQQQAAEQYWKNKMAQANDLSGIYQKQAGFDTKNADRQSQGGADIGAGIGKIAGSAATYLNSPNYSTQPATPNQGTTDSSLSTDELEKRQQARGF